MTKEKIDSCMYIIALFFIEVFILRKDCLNSDTEYHVLQYQKVIDTFPWPIIIIYFKLPT